MGKYMRKAKVTDDVVVMEVAESTIGVRTRAKTLALQRLHSSSAPDNSSPSDTPDDYLQLRSRRLRKISPLRPPPTRKNFQQTTTCKQDSEENQLSPVSTLGVGDWMNCGFVGSTSASRPNKGDGFLETTGDPEAEDDGVLGIQASFGENNLDFETRERVTRESTPCSLIREVDVVTPGSSTRQRSLDAANYRSQNAFLRNIPSTQELEEFFSHAELQEQRRFLEKYNFDVLTDMPLPGRYEWVRV